MSGGSASHILLEADREKDPEGIAVPTSGGWNPSFYSNVDLILHV